MENRELMRKLSAEMRVRGLHVNIGGCPPKKEKKKTVRDNYQSKEMKNFQRESVIPPSSLQRILIISLYSAFGIDFLHFKFY